MSEDRQVRLKRIFYRSWHRGCKELDLLLGAFAERELSTLSDELLDEYETLLEEDEWDIYNWLIDKTPVPAQFDNAIMKRLRDFKFAC